VANTAGPCTRTKRRQNSSGIRIKIGIRGVILVVNVGANARRKKLSQEEGNHHK
jgi:hypothetical protein